MIAVNCTVTRGEAAVCVVFNVVCGRVRFNYDREGPDRRRPRCEVRILVYGSAYIYISISRIDPASGRSARRNRKRETAPARRFTYTLKRRSRALHADAACDPV